MRNIYSFAVGFVSGAFGAFGWRKASSIVYRAPAVNRGRKIDGFDAFHSMTKGI